GRNSNSVRAAIPTNAACVASRVEYADTGRCGALKDRIYALHVGECRLVLAVVKAVADNRDAVVDHRVEEHLEARAWTREWCVINSDLHSWRETQDCLDANQHIALLIGNARRPTIDVHLAHVGEKCGRY